MLQRHSIRYLCLAAELAIVVYGDFDFVPLTLAPLLLLDEGPGASAKNHKRHALTRLEKAEILHYQGLNQQHLGELYSAQKLFQSSLQIKKQYCSILDVHTTQVQLAECLCQLEEHVIADNLLQESYNQRSEELAQTLHPALAQVQYLRGKNLRCQGGDLSKALKLVQESYAMYEKLLGKKHFHTIDAQEELGILLSLSNRPLEAVEILKDALESAQLYFGEAHYRTANIMAQLAWQFAKHGMPQQCLSFLETAESALLIFYNTQNEKITHIELLEICERKGEALSLLGQEAEALALLDMVLKRYRILQLVNRQKSVLQKIATVHTRMKNIKQQRMAYEQIYTLLMQNQDKKAHQAELAAVLSNLGYVELLAGNIEKSLAHHKKSLCIVDKLAQPHQNNMIYESYADVGVALLKLKRYAEAENYLSLVLDHRQSVADWDGMLNILTLQSEVYMNTGRLQEAVNVKQRTLQVLNEALGEDSPLCLLLAQNISKEKIACQKIQSLKSFKFSEVVKQLVDVNSLKQQENESCAVCLQNFKSSELLRLLPCNHYFHSECLDRWLFDNKMNCPYCRYAL